MSRDYCTVTTPIFYVNGSPHLGHAYTSIAADIVARFNRLAGKDVLFVSGTDEHGQKVAQTAASRDISPQIFADNVSKEFADMQKAMNVHPDYFVRTTDAKHKNTAQALWSKIASVKNDKGESLIYKSFYEGWYSTRDEAFIGEDEITIKDGVRYAPSGSPVEWLKEESYFFRLSEFTDKLLEFYEKNSQFLAPFGAKREVESFVKAGLRDLSVSRTSFDWGIPVPNDDKHVMYVWFDALANYLTAVDYPDTDSEAFKRFWPPTVQIVGKEITRFHCVYWPAFLMAAELADSKRVYAHGWWTVEGEKMSKSLGNVVNPTEIADRFGVDCLRYFLFREVPFGGDGSFSVSSLIERYNGELANDLGNLAQRTMTLIHRNADGLIRTPSQERDEESKELIDNLAALVGELKESMDKTALTEGLFKIWAHIRAGNAYIDKKAPWALAKTDKEAMKQVLWNLAELLRTVAVCLTPYIPQSMEKLLDQLGVPSDMRDLASLECALPERVIEKPTPIFPRIVAE